MLILLNIIEKPEWNAPKKASIVQVLPANRGNKPIGYFFFLKAVQYEVRDKTVPNDSS